MRRELRRFGLLVGGVFLALAAWWVFRGIFPLARVGAGFVGTFLVVAGAVKPSILAPIHRSWMGLAEILSRFVTRIILVTVYYLVVTPIGVALRIAGKDLLHRRGPRRETYWVDFPERKHDHFEKMY